MKKIAIVVFNLGGPSSLDELEPFLMNLFCDKNIIQFPFFLRYLVAKIIVFFRKAKSKKIYESIGGFSPILDITKQQAEKLETALNFLSKNDDKDRRCKNTTYKVFVSMRYSRPRTGEILPEIAKFDPSGVILLPLYPQYSTTTTKSSFEEWGLECQKHNFLYKTKFIYSYFDNEKYIKAWVLKIKQTYDTVENKPNTIILFSAHSIPQSVVNKGDPYKHQIELTVFNIMRMFETYYSGSKKIKHKICYQSKVGFKKWLEPTTMSELDRAISNKKNVLIVPISFVGDHSETLYELDIEYKNYCMERGMESFYRVESLNIDENFINALVGLCVSAHI